MNVRAYAHSKGSPENFFFLKMKAINREELAKHRHVNDCWLSVYGKVYDVTAYLDEHPGQNDFPIWPHSAAHT